jgi:probable HAF family extracellular repeat protein
MTPRRQLMGLVLLFVVIGPGQLLQADNGPYTVQDAGPAQAIGLAINASGAIVGTSAETGYRSAFLTPYGGGSLLLSGLEVGADAVAFGVHPLGWAVGAAVEGFYTRPVSFQSGSAVDLAPTAASGQAHAVNAAGAIAGWVDNGGVQAVVWSNGSATALTGTFYAQAYAINDAGLVTGRYYYATDGSLRAFKWTRSGAPALLASLGGSVSQGHGINEHGDVVGDSTASGSFDERAVWWKASGELIQLGTLGGATSSARDVNNQGHIVGYALDGQSRRRAFLSRAGGPMLDLNTLIDLDSGWVLLSANAINDAGQITGEGLFNDEPRAFLLTPAAADDTIAPIVGAVVTTPNQIWPPNHQMVDVEVQVQATDDSGETPVCAVSSVSSSEADNTQGDGGTTGDSQITGPLAVRVRAERSGASGERVYTIAIACTDASGNVGTGTGTVVIGEGSTAGKKKSVGL